MFELALSLPKCLTLARWDVESILSLFLWANCVSQVFYQHKPPFYPNTRLPTRPTNDFSQPTAWQTLALLKEKEREVLMSGKLCCNGRHLLGTASKSPVVYKQYPIGHGARAVLRKISGANGLQMKTWTPLSTKPSVHLALKKNTNLDILYVS